MKEDKFIKDNSEVWRILEQILTKLKSKGLNRFNRNEINDFMNYYNRTCSHLSYSRTNYGNSNTTIYLNRLVASAHSYIYTTQTSSISKLLKFFYKDFPLLLRKNLLCFLLSSGLFLFGTFISFLYTASSTDNAYAFLPKSMVDNTDFNHTLADTDDFDSSIMSSSILTNNIRVGFNAFALGLSFGVGTLAVLIYNGFMLGGLGALAFKAGFNLKFWSLILPHGILELFAIFVCGAAGLLIGYALINPGQYSRKDALILRGKTAVKLVCGTVPIFVIAGMIEGFFTPMKIAETSKIIFASGTFLILLAYLIIPNIKYAKEFKS
ncbi:MAG: stage II sporulation protein M [Clostridia bacterium]|nr:stage II sporulation protein M [Clostridia bacterium]